jgi:hypothetical protein
MPHSPEYSWETISERDFKELSSELVMKSCARRTAISLQISMVEIKGSCSKSFVKN